MSPVSRGRKHPSKKDKRRRPDRRKTLTLPEIVDGLIADLTKFSDTEDVVEIELAGTGLLALDVDGSFEPRVVDQFIPLIEAKGTADALAYLLAVGSVAGGPVAAAVFAAADRMIGAGVPVPPWTSALAEPATVGECSRLFDSAGDMSMFSVTFERGGLAHALVVAVDHQAGDLAHEIMLVPADELPKLLGTVRSSMAAGNVTLEEERLDAADLRLRVERALDVRAAFDAEHGRQPEPADDNGWVVNYAELAVLTRARMRLLPESPSSA